MLRMIFWDRCEVGLMQAGYRFGMVGSYQLKRARDWNGPVTISGLWASFQSLYCNTVGQLHTPDTPVTARGPFVCGPAVGPTKSVIEFAWDPVWFVAVAPHSVGYRTAPITITEPK